MRGPNLATSTTLKSLPPQQGCDSTSYSQQAHYNIFICSYIQIPVYLHICIDYLLQESHIEKYDADPKETEAPTKYPLHSLQNEKLKNKKYYIP